MIKIPSIFKFVGWQWEEESFWVHHSPILHWRTIEVTKSFCAVWKLFQICDCVMTKCYGGATKYWALRSSEQFRMSLWSEKAGTSGTGEQWYWYFKHLPFCHPNFALSYESCFQHLFFPRLLMIDPTTAALTQVDCHVLTWESRENSAIKSNVVN